MKTKFNYYLVLSFAMTFWVFRTNTNVQAQTLIQFWDFNQTRPTSGGGGDSLGTVFSYANPLETTDSTDATWPLPASYSASGLTAGYIVYYRPQTIYSSFGRDSIVDNKDGGSFLYDYSSSSYTYFNYSDSGFSGGNMFIRTRNPSDSCQFVMYIPTTGYKNINLYYAISASSTSGALYNVFSYSTNGGTTWNNLTTAMDTFNISGVYRPDTLQVINPTTSGSDWYPVQINFTSDPNVNNNANFVLRFEPTGGNSVGSSGNDRYDNFAVFGTSTTSGINELPAQVAGYNIYPNPVTDYVNVISNNYTGDKLITTYDVVGQKVSMIENSSLQTIINTSQLNSGVYFIEIREMSTGNQYTVKIVKE